jgi:hypothetical protein
MESTLPRVRDSFVKARFSVENAGESGRKKQPEKTAGTGFAR